MKTCNAGPVRILKQIQHRLDSEKPLLQPGYRISISPFEKGGLGGFLKPKKE
jgi:hypothetical protein